MSKNRLFHDQPKTRLIVSVECDSVAAVDRLLRRCRLTPGNRSEFVRLAIEEKLGREAKQTKSDD